MDRCETSDAISHLVGMPRDGWRGLTVAEYVHADVSGELALRQRDKERIMDLIDRHFAAENAHDIPGTLATYTDDVVWDDVGHPACPVYGKSAAAEIYEGIMDGIPDLHLKSVARFACGDHVVDESIATGHVTGSFMGIDGGGAPVRFRILHVFDIRDGLISREQAWFDTAGVARQLEAHARGQASPMSP